MACKWVCFAFRALPLPAWRTFLLDRHIDHCPRCRGEALDDEAIRSLGVTPADLQNEPSLLPPAAGRRLPRRRAIPFDWRYAFGALLAVTLLGALVALFRLTPPEPIAQGTVYVTEGDAHVRVFAVIEARIGDEPARPILFKPGQPGMTIVWFEKTKN